MKSFKAAVHRRIANIGSQQVQQPYPVTLIRQPTLPKSENDTTTTTTITNTANGPGQLQSAGTAALQAIKRHAMDFVNPKELLVSAE